MPFQTHILEWSVVSHLSTAQQRITKIILITSIKPFCWIYLSVIALMEKRKKRAKLGMHEIYIYLGKLRLSQLLILSSLHNSFLQFSRYFLIWEQKQKVTPRHHQRIKCFFFFPVENQLNFLTLALCGHLPEGETFKRCLLVKSGCKHDLNSESRRALFSLITKKFLEPVVHGSNHGG